MEARSTKQVHGTKKKKPRSETINLAVVKKIPGSSTNTCRSNKVSPPGQENAQARPRHFLCPQAQKKPGCTGPRKWCPRPKNMLPQKKRSPYIVITTLTVYIPRILPRNSASSKHHHPSGLTLPALVGCSVVWTWSFRLRSQHTGMLYTGHKLQAFSTAPCSNTDEKFVLGATKRLICQLRKLRAQKLLDKTYRFLNLKSPPQKKQQTLGWKKTELVQQHKHRRSLKGNTNADYPLVNQQCDEPNQPAKLRPEACPLAIAAQMIYGCERS